MNVQIANAAARGLAALKTLPRMMVGTVIAFTLTRAAVAGGPIYGRSTSEPS